VGNKLDKILENQAYMIKLLETIVESIGTRKKPPDIMKIMKPVMDSPALKGNPVFEQMMSGLKETIGED